MNMTAVDKRKIHTPYSGVPRLNLSDTIDIDNALGTYGASRSLAALGPRCSYVQFEMCLTEE